MRKIIFAFLIFAASLFLSGCVHYVELGELAVVENLSIDFQDGEFHIIATLIEKKEEVSRKIVEGRGKTINDATDAIKTKENKKLYIAHLKLLTLTPNAINEKLEDVINYFLENTESRNDFMIAINDDLDMMRDTSKTLDIVDKIKIIDADLGTTKACYFEDFLKDLLERKDSYLPVLVKSDEGEEIRVDGIYLLEDYKVSKKLTKNEVILFNFMDNAISTCNYRDNKVLANDTRILFKGEKVRIRIESVLAEEDKKYITELEEDIRKMFDDYKELGIDIFNIGHYIKIRNYDYYKKNEDDLLDEVILEFDIKVKANNTGERRIELDGES